MANEYLVAFANISGLSAVKRRMLPLHVQMRRAPACVSKDGCGYALMCGKEILPEIMRHAVAIGALCTVYGMHRDNGNVEYLSVKPGGADDLS